MRRNDWLTRNNGDEVRQRIDASGTFYAWGVRLFYVVGVCSVAAALLQSTGWFG